MSSKIKQYFANKENRIKCGITGGTIALAVIIFVLLFLLATSNMRNHPKIAKCLFLFPWLDMVLGMAAQIISDIL